MMMNKTTWIVAAGLMLMSAGAYAQPQTIVSSKQSQQDLNLTVYSNFAVIKDIREKVLPRGEVLLEYRDVASTLVPASVLARTSGIRDGIRVLEQSYRYDLLNRQSLLETYIGRKLKYSRTVLQGTSYEKVLREGILLSTNPEIVDFGDEIEISPEGTISLPVVPEGLILNPSLVWLLENPIEGSQQIETTYVAEGWSWQADYALRLDEQRGELDLTSWATIRNESGAQFNNATVKLVAGNVNRAPRQQPRAAKARESMMLMADAAPQVSEFAAYQAYDLPRKTSFLNHEEKQITFIHAESVPYEQRFRLASQLMAYANPRPQPLAVTSEIEFLNKSSEGLGLPMPEGTARVYVQSEAGQGLVGESRFVATPVGQTVTLQLGQAFDLTARREQMSFSRISDRTFEASFEVYLANATDMPQVIEIEEAMQGDWEVLESSAKSSKLNSQTLGFSIQVPAKGETTLQYRVRWKN